MNIALNWIYATHVYISPRKTFIRLLEIRVAEIKDLL